MGANVLGIVIFAAMEVVNRIQQRGENATIKLMRLIIIYKDWLNTSL